MKNYIKLDDEYFSALSNLKRQNYERIYNEDQVSKSRNAVIKQMMQKLYDKLKEDLIKENRSSPIFAHHIGYIFKYYYKRKNDYLKEDKDQIVVDYIASMTDDYFIELYNKLFIVKIWEEEVFNLCHSKYWQ